MLYHKGNGDGPEVGRLLRGVLLMVLTTALTWSCAMPGGVSAYAESIGVDLPSGDPPMLTDTLTHSSSSSTDDGSGSNGQSRQVSDVSDSGGSAEGQSRQVADVSGGGGSSEQVRQVTDVVADDSGASGVDQSRQVSQVAPVVVSYDLSGFDGVTITDDTFTSEDSRGLVQVQNPREGYRFGGWELRHYWSERERREAFAHGWTGDPWDVLVLADGAVVDHMRVMYETRSSRWLVDELPEGTTVLEGGKASDGAEPAVAPEGTTGAVAADGASASGSTAIKLDPVPDGVSFDAPKLAELGEDKFVKADGRETRQVVNLADFARDGKVTLRAIWEKVDDGSEAGKTGDGSEGSASGDVGGASGDAASDSAASDKEGDASGKADGAVGEKPGKDGSGDAVDKDGKTADGEAKDAGKASPEASGGDGVNPGKDAGQKPEDGADDASGDGRPSDAADDASEEAGIVSEITTPVSLVTDPTEDIVELADVVEEGEEAPAEATVTRVTLVSNRDGDSETKVVTLAGDHPFLPDCPFEWAHHQFVGWFANRSDNKISGIATEEIPPGSDLTFYAAWAETMPDRSVIEGLDFSSRRLVVGSATKPSLGTVVSSGDDAWVIEFKTKVEAAWGYVDLLGKVDFVAPDVMIGVASADDLRADLDGSSDSAAALSGSAETPDPSGPVATFDVDAPRVASGRVVALIDTGVSAGVGIDGRSSVIGDVLVDDNGHGTSMAEAMRLVDPDVRIWSIKAADSSGVATASSLYAAIEAAIEMRVSVISVSFSALATNGNAAVEEAIRDAHAAGIMVVGAAGNNGNDAKWYIPGRMGDEAVIVGASDEDGARRSFSNYGDTVDVYVPSDSTSVAAAKVAGWLANHGEFGHEVESLAGEEARSALGLYVAGEADESRPAEEVIPSPEDSDGDFYSAWTDIQVRIATHYQRTGTWWDDGDTNLCYKTGSWHWANANGATTEGGMYSAGRWISGDMWARLEGFGAYAANWGSTSGSVAYIIHRQTTGDTGWAYNGAMLGNDGNSKRCEALMVHFDGNAGTGYGWGLRVIQYGHDKTNERHDFSNTTGGWCGSGGISGRIVDLWVRAFRHGWNQYLQVRYQNANGSYGAYQAKINRTYYAGETVSWSVNDATYRASTSWTAWGAASKSLDVPRKTASNTVRYRFQNENGGWGGWTSTSKTLRVGESWTWSRAQDATYSAASVTITGTQSAQTKDVSIYRRTWTARFNGNGHTGGSMSNESFYVGQTKALTSNGFSRTGYTFGGWAASATGSVSWSNGQSVKDLAAAGGTKDLYAKWDVNPYTVTYVPGNGETWADTSATYDTQFTVVPPTLLGYAFRGWNITGMDSCTHVYGSETSTTTTRNNEMATVYKNLRSTNGTVTMTAQWEPNVSTIAYNLVGGTGGEFAPTTSTYDAPTIISHPTRLGYTFMGWRVEGMDTLATHEYGESAEDFETTTEPSIDLTKATYFRNLLSTTGTLTFTAVWQANPYQIDYDLDGGLPSAALPTQTTYSSSLSIVNPTRVGYTFAGWDITGMDTCRHEFDGTPTTEESAEGVKATTFLNLRSTDGVVHFKATWTPNTYRLSYVDVPDTSGLPTEAAYGETFTLTPRSRVGYDFVGWSISKMALNIPHVINGETYEDIESIDNLGADGSDVTCKDLHCLQGAVVQVRALWHAHGYNLAYDLADSGLENRAVLGRNTPTEAMFGTTLTILPPTCVGYEFCGWTITGMDEVSTHTIGGESFTGTTLTEPTKATSFMNLRADPTEPVVLHATWRIATYDIVYEGVDEASGCAFAGRHPSSGTYGQDVLVDGATRFGYDFGGWRVSGMDSYPHYVGDETDTEQEFLAKVVRDVTTLDATTSKRFRNLRSGVGTVTFSAVWLPHHYNLAFVNVDAADVAAYPSRGAFDVSLSLRAPKRQGHKFVRWSVSGMDACEHTLGSVTTHAASAVTTATSYMNLRSDDGGTVTFTAEWQANNYTLEYRGLEGADPGQTLPTTATSVEELSIANPTKVGYVFDGWAVANMNGNPVRLFEDGEWQELSTSSVTTKATKFVGLRQNAGTVVLEATWHPVVYDIEYLGLEQALGVDDLPTRATYDAAFVVSPPSRIGATFKGWTITGMDDTVHVVGMDELTDDMVEEVTAMTFMNLRATAGTVTFEAIWEENGYTVVYDNVMGASFVDDNHPDWVQFEDEFTVSHPVRPGYDFVGWRLLGMDRYDHVIGDEIFSDVTYDLTDATTFAHLRNTTGVVTFYAQWEALPYSIVYAGLDDAVEDPNAMRPSSAIYDVPFAVSKPSRFGYTFAGWDITGMDTSTHVVGLGTNSASSMSNCMETGFANLRASGGTVTFTARWTPVTYTIAYEGVSDAVLGAHHPTSVAYGSEFVVDAPTKAGSSFQYWIVRGMDGLDHEIGGDVVSGYEATNVTATTFKNLRATGGVVTFEAVWSTTAYDVTFVGVPAQDYPARRVSALDTFGVDIPSRIGYTFAGWDITGMDTSLHTIGSFTSSATSLSGVRAESFFRLRGSEGTVTFTAVWTPISYDIAYEGVSGATMANMPSSAAYATTFTVSNPTKPNYTFEGWCISGMDDCEHTVGASTTTATSVPPESMTQATSFRNLRRTAGTVTFRALWSVASYDVTYDANGGSLSGTAPTSVSCGESFVVEHPTRSGYAFAGWNVTGLDGTEHLVDGVTTTATSLSGTKARQFGNLRGSAGAVSFTATWTDVTYAISYTDVAGGYLEGAGAPPTSVTSTESFTVPAPTWGGREFVGWNVSGMDGTDHTIGGSTVSSTSVTETTATTFAHLRSTSGTVTFSAQWSSAPYSITYAGMDGASYGAAHPASARVGTAVVIDNPSKEGHTFEGWSVSGMDNSTHVVGGVVTAATSVSGVKGTLFRDLTMVSNGVVTLTAMWSRNKYYVSFKGLDNATPSSIDRKTVYYGDSFSVANPTKAGSTFLGWTITNMDTSTHSLSSDGGSSWSSTQFTSLSGQKGSGSNSLACRNLMSRNASGNLADDVVFEAKWSLNTYKVGYNLAGGTIAEDGPTTITYGDTFSVLTPTRDGYTFAGWNITNMDTSPHTIGGGTSNATSVSNEFSSSYANLRMSGDDSNKVMFTATWNARSKVVRCVDIFCNSAKSTAAGSYLVLGEVSGLSSTGAQVSASNTTMFGANRVYPGYTYDSCSAAVQVPAVGDAVVYRFYKADVNVKVIGPDSTELDGMASYTKSASHAWRNSVVSVSNISSLDPSNYVFDGSWVSSDSASGLPATGASGGVYSFRMVEGTHNILIQLGYASWTIHYNLNGGSGATDYSTTTVNLPLVIDSGSHVSKSNATLKGWNTASDGSGVSYAPGTTVVRDMFGGNSVTLYAQWSSSITYNVQYDLNGGSFSSGTRYPPTTVGVDERFYVPVPSTVPGGNFQTFDHWYVTGMDDGPHYIGLADSSVAPMYGTTWSSPQTANGMPTSEINMNRLTYQRLRASSGTVTFTAVYRRYLNPSWDPAEASVANMREECVRVIYNANNVNATGAMSIQDYTMRQYEQGGDLFTHPCEFEWPGHKCVRWTTNPDGSGEFAVPGNAMNVLTDNGPFPKTVNLYAQWSVATYSAIFKYNDGTENQSKVDYDMTNSQTVAFPSIAGLRRGYRFLGWIGGGASETWATPMMASHLPASVTEDREYTAQWAPKTYHILFDANADGDAVANMPGEFYFSYGSGVSLPSGVPVRAGYVFDGWYMSGSVMEPGSALDPDVFGDCDDGTSITLVAQWTPIEYVATFDGGVASPQTFTINSSVTQDNSSEDPPETDSRHFDGWVGTGISAPTKVVNIPVGSTGDRAYTAVYSDNFAAVHYRGGAADVTRMPDDGTVVNGNDYRVSTTVPERLGYTFAGWALSDVENPSDLSALPLYQPGTLLTHRTSDTYLIGRWEAVSYRVTLDLANAAASLPVGSQSTFFYGVTSPAFTLPVPVHQSRTFLGWIGTGLSSPQVTVTVPSGSTGDRSYTALWGPVTYTVSYHDSHGATGLPASDVVTVGDAYMVSGMTPSRPGYMFSGWDLDGNVLYPSSVINSGLAQTGGTRVTLEATWTVKPYALDIDLNDLNGSPATIDCVDTHLVWNAETGLSVPLASGGTSTFVPDPVRDGYTFDGWDVVPEDHAITWTNGHPGIPAGAVGDVRIVARWRNNSYEVAYAGGAASGVYGVPDSFTIPCDVTGTVSSVVPSRFGYTFTGWAISGSDERDGEVLSSSESFVNLTVTNGGHVTLTAQWSPTTYTATLDLNDSGDYPATMVPADTSIQFSAEDADISLPVPTRPEHAFLGWLGGDSSTPVKNARIASGSVGDRSYTAMWAPYSYTVRFVNNQGGTASDMPADMHCLAGVTYRIGDMEPTLPGYEFVNWHMVETGFSQDVSYQRGDSFVDMFSEFGYADASSSPVVRLEAVWRPLTYELTFDLASEIGSSPVTFPYQTNITFTAAEAAVRYVPNPSRVGYEFCGWIGSELAGLTKNLVVPSTVGDKTYVAVWRPYSYHVEYTTEAPDDVTHMPEPFDALFDTYVKLGLNAPQRDGYYFNHWALVGSDATYNLDQRVRNLAKTDGATATLEASWTLATYYATFDLDDATVRHGSTYASFVNGDGTAAPNPLAFHITSPDIPFPNPTRVGYDFCGWVGGQYAYPDFVGKVESGSIGDRTYKATWEPHEYDLTFDTESPSTVEGMPSDMHVVFDKAFMFPSKPTRTGYEFLGWELDEADAPNLTNGHATTFADHERAMNLTSDDDVLFHFHAVWRIIPYDIVVDLGEEDGVTPVSWAHDDITWTNTSGDVWTRPFTVESPTFDVADPIRRGYFFEGWIGTDSHEPVKSYSHQRGWVGDVNLAATWRPIEFNVHYASDVSGASNMPEDATVLFGTPYTVPTEVPYINGYSFEGYLCDDLGDDPIMPGDSLENATDVDGTTFTLTAHFEPIPYRYTLHLRDASNEPPLGSTYADRNGGTEVVDYVVTDPDIAIPDPSRVGYTFEGWAETGTLDPGVKNLVIPSGTTRNAEFDALWDPIEYTITYGSVAGTENLPADQVVSFDSTAQISLTIPTRYGYSFLGWEDSEGVVHEAGESVLNLCEEQGAEFPLEAVWEPIPFTVLFDLNDAGIYPAEFEGEREVVRTVESEALAVPDPTRYGFVFDGWTTAGQTDPVKNLVVPGGTFGDVTYVAQWHPITYHIVFVSEGGAHLRNMPEPQPVRFGEEAYLTDQEPVRDGFEFIGWYTVPDENEDVDEEAGELWEPGRDITGLTMEDGAEIYVYAHWHRVAYVAQFDFNDSLGSTRAAWPAELPEDFELAEGNKVYFVVTSPAIHVPNPERQGYRFLGWTDGVSGAPVRDLVIDTGSVGDRVYTGWWTPVTYTLHFDGSEVEGYEATDLPEDLTATFDMPGNMPGEVPRMGGYNFCGWHLGEVESTGDGTGVDYKPNDEFINLADTQDAVVTMKAVWTEMLGVRVPMAFHYIVSDNHVMVGPGDGAVSIENVGTAPAKLIGVGCEGDGGHTLVSGGEADEDGEVSLSMTVDGHLMDFATHEGEPFWSYDDTVFDRGETVPITRLIGVHAGEASYDEERVALIHWRFQAMPRP